jgi:predicted RNA-binding Zn ribbon-like protein
MKRYATTLQPNLKLSDLRLLGDRLCLDFANSVEMPLTNRPIDLVRSYVDLVAWGALAGLLDERSANWLRREAGRAPDESAAVFARAIALRDAITRVFTAVAGGVTPEAADLALIHREHLAALAHTRFTAMAGGFTLAEDGENELDRVLWPVVRSAVDLLLTGDPARVKRCAGPGGGCGWLFYDVSRNGSRRWCSMEGCGSQAKMRRYRARGREPDVDRESLSHAQRAR